MRLKSFVSIALVALFIVTSGDPVHLIAANLRSFIESVRTKAPVVYVASVREVQILQRTKFDIKARAVVDVLVVMRSPGTNPGEATIEYSTYDDKTPMLAGGPQYQLSTGAKVVAFVNSFASRIPPGYLIHGNPEELLHHIESLRDGLRHMSADQLKVNEINEQDRRTQIALYDKLCAYLTAAK